jgi:hypothetical protein
MQSAFPSGFIACYPSTIGFPGPVPIQFNYTNTSYVMPQIRDLDRDGDADLLTHTRFSVGATYVGYLRIYDNLSILGTGVPGSNGTMGFPIGGAQLGNALFYFGVSNALPSAPCILALSATLAEGASTGNGIWVDLPSALLLSVNGVATPMLTDAAGNVYFPAPIPLNLSLLGATLYAQWAVADPLGMSFNGSVPLALTRTRQITLRL